MRSALLIWYGVTRNRTRSALILLQIIIAFALFGLLQGLDSSMRAAVAGAHADRLFVGSHAGGSDLLPVALLGRIETVPGIARVAFESQLPCTYHQPNQPVFGLGVDLPAYLDVYPENEVAAEQITALEHTRNGAVVGEALARQYGWKIGDRVSLQCFVPHLDGSTSWTFNVVGFFRQKERPEFAALLLLNYGYINEARAIDRNTVNVYGLRIRNPADAAEIGHRIDIEFDNSTTPTQTQSDAEAAQKNFKRIGDVAFLTKAITSAAFFALLVATGSLMTLSIRERTPELGLLKAIGFSGRQIAVLVLMEGEVLAICGALVGMALASIVLPHSQEIVGSLSFVPPAVFAKGVACACTLAVASALVPAWRAARLNPVDTLAGR